MNARKSNMLNWENKQKEEKWLKTHALCDIGYIT